MPINQVETNFCSTCKFENGYDYPCNECEREDKWKPKTTTDSKIYCENCEEYRKMKSEYSKEDNFTRFNCESCNTTNLILEGKILSITIQRSE